MTLKAQCVSALPENEFGSLSSCLVEGDPQSEKRARRIKQRAVAISVALQSLALVALLLFPLLSKGERISLKYATPIPPFAPTGVRHPAPSDPGRRISAPCRFCQPPSVPTTISLHVPDPSPLPNGPDGDVIVGLPPTPGVEGGITPSSSRPVAPREDKVPAVKERMRVSEMQQTAQLIRRIDPSYPTLARQIQREGRVELHALISTEGRIESLEVISGDPLFIQSALSAVREWRYRPTILNNRPVEIDTHITVIYTLSH
ncbi:MAG TPA: TonB family protein [Candidatus Limnocylindrales bacterium]|nr:TonB family protein [Candidatus Limnocylindrales bacterium]